MNWRDLQFRTPKEADAIAAEMVSQVAQAVAAERAQCLRKTREIQAEHRAASESAWAGKCFDVAANHQEAVACAEEIAQAIERGEG